MARWNRRRAAISQAKVAKASRGFGAIVQGANAFRKGVLLEGNPFKQAEDREAWCQGWCEAWMKYKTRMQEAKDAT